VSTAPSSVRVRRAAVAVPDRAASLAIARHLGRRGFELIEAASLDELLAVSETLGPDGLALALLDVQLPGGARTDAIRRILERWPDVVTVLVAPGADEAAARVALERGAAGYLLRPFGLFELDAVVARALARLELAEMKRQRAERPELSPIVDFELLPTSWLHWGDERSAAGPGHGYRVARMAKVIAAMLPSLDGEERWPLEFAARAHELGWLHGPPAPGPVIAERTTAMLGELGVDERVVAIIGAMHERWDGSGGPRGLEGRAIAEPALVLAVADRVDHDAAASPRARGRPELSIGAAIDRLLDTRDPGYAPHVLSALARARSAIESMWSIATGFPEH
jgi:response regulator RpfG family c-di-GMP phosphodiesterase